MFVRTTTFNALFLALALCQPAFGQTPDLGIEIRPYEKADIQLEALPARLGAWVEEDEETLLSRCKLGKVRGFDVYYDYAERYLIPKPEEKCLLHIYVGVPEKIPGTNRKRRLWYQPHLLTVSGTFIDQDVPLTLQIDRGGAITSGTIVVTAHARYPEDLLIASDPDGIWIDVSTGKSTFTDLKFANRSKDCAILFKEAKIRQQENELWNKPAVLKPINPRLEARGEGSIQPWLSLALEPRSSRAFWRSFSFVDNTTPDSELKFDILLQVEGGREANVHQTIKIRFLPPGALDLFSVVLGSLLGSSLSILVASLKPRKNQVAGKAQLGSMLPENAATTTASAVRSGPNRSHGWRKFFQELWRWLVVVVTSKTARQLLTSVLVAIIVYWIYQFLKGEKRVILFEFSLDPTQIFPSALIGFVVGLRPVFFFQKLHQTFFGSTTPRAVFLLISAILACETSVPARAQTQFGFRPVTIIYDPLIDGVYVLSSSENTIYRGVHDSKHLERVKNFGPQGTTTDICLLSWRGSLSIASVSSRILDVGETWATTVRVTPVSKGGLAAFRTFFGFRQFHGVTCDSQRSRLILTDRAREGIYVVPITSSGVGDPKLRFSHPLLKAPTAIVARGETVYVAAGSKVLEIDLAAGKVKTLLENLVDPSGLALAPGSPHLLVAESAQGRILEVNLKDGGHRELLKSANFREPRAIAVDESGKLWIGDAWAGVVLEFRSDGTALRRLNP